MAALYDTPFLESLRALEDEALVFCENENRIYAGTVYRNSLSIAHGLRALGFLENDRVAFLVPPGEEFLEIFFALNFLKGTLAIIDPEMGRANFDSKLRQFAPRWIFIDSRLLLLKEHPILRFIYEKRSKNPISFSVPSNCRVIATGKMLPLFRKVIRLKKLKCVAVTEAPLLPAGDHDMMVTYTSGTLDEPKGVVHSIHSLYASLLQIKKILSAHPDSRIAAYLPHFLLIGICSGTPVFLYEKNKAAAWRMNFFRQNKITILFGPPSDYLPLIDHCKTNGMKLPKCLELIILGSAPVHPSFLNMLYEVIDGNARVMCLYGMTENLIVCGVDGKEKMNSAERGDVVGKPFENVAISIADDGELLLDSPQLFSRYLHLEKRETPHATGDLGYLSLDGTVVLTGRKKDMIIRHDMNIYPAVYEKTIKNIPGIKEAVLIGIYSEAKHDEEVILAVEAENLSESTLRAKLKKGEFSIDKQAQPDRIVFIKIPRSGRQDKIDRKKLRELLSS